MVDIVRNIESLLHEIKGKRILVLGDVMLDTYIYGDVKRISPEAPVPIVNYSHERHFLGGAGNVVRNLRALDCQPFLIAGLGSDANGQNIEQKLETQVVPFFGIREIGNELRRTTQKVRIFGNGHQQLIRLDEETPMIWDIDYSDKIFAKIGEWRASDDWRIPHPIDLQERMFDAIIISDYDKGFVIEPVIKRLLNYANDENIPIIADPKCRNFWNYEGFCAITPNRQELETALPLRYGPTILQNYDIYKLSQMTCKGLKLNRLLVTHGSDGMYLYNDMDMVTHYESDSQQLRDVTGAGDTVIAAYGAAISSLRVDHEAAVSFASFCAGIAVDNLGTFAPNVHAIKKRVALLKQRQETTGEEHV